jgi:hypothetical protein
MEVIKIVDYLLITLFNIQVSQFSPLNNYVLERFYSREFGEALVRKCDYSEG